MTSRSLQLCGPREDSWLGTDVHMAFTELLRIEPEVVEEETTEETLQEEKLQSTDEVDDTPRLPLIFRLNAALFDALNSSHGMKYPGFSLFLVPRMFRHESSFSGVSSFYQTLLKSRLISSNSISATGGFAKTFCVTCSMLVAMPSRCERKH